MSAEPEKKEGAGSDIMKAIRIEKLVHTHTRIHTHSLTHI
jgi:hypothetical protein